MTGCQEISHKNYAHVIGFHVTAIRQSHVNCRANNQSVYTGPPRRKHQHTEVSMSTARRGEMDITSREVLEELKCPVCVEYMMPPIPMCQNGHNICNTCRQKVNQCPTCKEEFFFIQMLDSGEYYSENKVSLPVL